MKTTETALEPVDTESILRENVEKLRDLLRSVELTGKGEHASTIQDVARISVALISACAELRQHAKAGRRVLASFPLDQVIAHLRSLPEAKLDEVVRELTGDGNEEPLL